MGKSNWSITEIVEPGSCAPQALDSTTTEGSGIGHFIVQLIAHMDSVQKLPEKFSLSVPSAARLITKKPVRIESEQTTKRFVYETNDLILDDPERTFVGITIIQLEAYLPKPILDLESFVGRASSVIGVSNPSELIVDSSLEIEALADLDHLSGQIHWPRLLGGMIKARLLEQSAGRVHEATQAIVFPETEGILKNPLEKGRKVQYNLKIGYRKPDGGGLGVVVPIPCEMGTINAHVSGLRVTTGSQLPFPVEILGEDDVTANLVERKLVRVFIRTPAELVGGF